MVYGRGDSVFNPWMNLFRLVTQRFCKNTQPEHSRRGKLGERAAKKYLQKQGLKFLAANFRSKRGEIDLIFRERSRKGLIGILIRNGTDCLVFVEVKTRSTEGWTRPAAAVNARKKKLLSQTALDYLRRLKNPEVKFRFDIVEVLLGNGDVREIRHLPNTFALSKPYRFA